MEKKKNSYIAMTIVSRLAVTTILINVIMVLVVGSMARNAMQSKEGDYLEEIIANMSSTISTTIHEYIAIADIVALNGEIITLLEQSTVANPMHKQDVATSVLRDISSIQSNFPEVLNIAIMDVDQDGYLLHNGSYSGDGFSFKTREYYQAVTTRTSMVTAPYVDVESGGLVISAAAPVVGSNNVVLGAVVVDLSISFLGDLVREGDFGNSGYSIIIDSSSGMIMAHSTASYIGQDYSVLSMSGSALQAEFSNPSKTIIDFKIGSDSRVGEVGKVQNLDWIMVTSTSSQEFNAETNTILLTLLGMVLLSVFATMVVVTVTVVVVLKPLFSIKVAMNELSLGNLHYHLEYESTNEIGHLADDIRVTMSNLADYIDEIQRLLTSYGHGDFTVNSDMEFQGDFHNIQLSIQGFSQLISDALEGIKATVEQVTIGSDYVATGSQNLAEGSMRQSDSVSELNVHVSDIAEKVRKNVETVDQVNQASTEMSQGLLVGNKHMAEMVKSMEEISRTSEGIQKIIKTIEDVAFQTNILALNAAVEAARAGTSGRGFAVVAEEVRNLSTRTTTAVQETTTLIEETVVAVRGGTEIVDSTAKCLNDVLEGLDGFMDSLEKITAASQDQSIAIQSIYQDVTQITTVMQTNSAISEESAATSEELSSQAAVMKDTIDQFRTK